MSILASLARAYDRLPDAPPFGYSSEKIGFLISLNEDGTVANVVDLRDGEGKKKQPRVLPVPASFKRPGVTPRAFFLWDNSAYVLGISANEAKGCEPRRAAFLELHRELLKDTDDAGLTALLLFVEQWHPDDFERLGWPEEMKDQNIVFALENERRERFLHQRPAAKSIWAKKVADGKSAEAVCLVTGERAPIARLHQAIKGVKGGQVAGGSIVSFNLDAFTSYGHAQGDNAPVSEAVVFAYTTALNRFLERDSGHRVQIGDASTVFWADASSIEVAEIAESFFSQMIEPFANDAAETKQVAVQLERIRKGEPLAKVEPDLTKGVKFYVLGLAPNAARLSIRFWLESSFAKIADNYKKYTEEIHLSRAADLAQPLARLLLETVPLTDRDRRFLASPNAGWKSVIGKLPDGQQKYLGLLASDCLYAILNGTPYPLTLLGNTISRIRADKIINAERLALIKAVLIRNFIRPLPETTGKQSRKELFVALDRTEDDPAYVLGRLFAVLEKIQEQALGKLNANIKTKYFGAASSTPHSVFPLLLRLNVHHQDKAEKDPKKRGLAIYFDKEKQEIMNLLKPDFPRFLRLKDQGKFFLGYEHQMYVPKKTDPSEVVKTTDTGETDA
jgi:CRISPR-associated protein Csd1